MRILYVSQYFSPEPGAASVRAREFVESWVKKDEHVSVICGFPIYLKGKIYRGYKNDFYKIEKHNNLDIFRTFTVSYHSGSIIKRILSQINFLLCVLVCGFFIRGVDIIVISSPPFPLGIVGMILGWLKRVPWVFEVRDLFPDSAVNFGVLTNVAIIKLLKILEKIFYNKSSLIVAATKGLKKEIVKKGVAPKKIITVLNGVNLEMFKPGINKKNINDYIPVGKDKYIIIYTGLIGRAHGANKIIDIAKNIKENKEIVFLFVGDGPEKCKIEKMVQDYGLDNVYFLCSKPYDEIPKFISMADIGIASVLQTDFTKNSIPVKIFEYMAAGKPVILLGKGETSTILKNSNAGYAIDQDNVLEASNTIIKILYNDDLKRKLGKNGRKFVKENYSRKTISLMYLEQIRKLI